MKAHLKNPKRLWTHNLLLVLVLAAATYFRLVGLNWDADQHLHPDERFLTMVESALQVKKCALPNMSLESCPAEQVRWLGLGDYLNTLTSPLNPQNRGFGFFVYGDLPIVIVRYIAEWIGQVGYDQVHLVGRHISALSDLLTIVLIYGIAVRLYDRRVALWTAAFSAFAVLQIQQSHFFTVDTVANLFIFLALYCAVEIVCIPAGLRRDIEARPGNAIQASESPPASELPMPGLPSATRTFPAWRDPLLLYSLGFGVALGLAVASKLNAVPLAILLPGALLVRSVMLARNQEPPAGDRPAEANGIFGEVDWSRIAIYLVAGAIAFAFVFRLSQPYAFSGLGLNPAWLANIRELRGQSSGDVDVPFALQWARRSRLFSFTNLTVWGLGLPLGILAWVGFIFMAWRIFKGELRHLLLWSWTAIYFFWQSLAFNPTMRYQLPIYPLLCMMAGWFIVYLWRQASNGKSSRLAFVFRLSSLLVGFSVLLLTVAWAAAFTRIYTRPVTRLAATRWIFQNIPGPINLRIRTVDGDVYQQPMPFPAGDVVAKETPYLARFKPNVSGTITGIYLPHVAASNTDPGITPQNLHVSLSLEAAPSTEPPIAEASLTSDFARGSDGRGSDYTLSLDSPMTVIKDQSYAMRLEAGAGLTLVGAAPINESDWDDGLPLRLGAEGYDGFGGIYEGGLNLQIYWDDNPEKLKRFVDTLSQGDAIFMSSNRQWATVTRVPERYPLTTAYYRALIGCPVGKDVIWCYNVARPGMFEGQLGYRLTAVFESFPTIGIPGVFNWQVNDQFAEEAFTVYDHPKVLIFQKQADFSTAQVQDLLGAVDLSHVVHLTPKEAAGYRDLRLSPEALARQQAGGTWSELFNYNWLQNRFPVFGLLFWYLFILVLGVLTYPIIRLALPGLADKGYPLARVLGLVLLGYLSWLSGSLGIPVTRASIAVTFSVLAAAGLALAWRQRVELVMEWRSRRSYFWLVEGLFLAFFFLDLVIRIGNPDLWHPAKGGERPMDFSYFNAILKSTSFPPYDPWFAGGYINYYYYGFVLVSTPVKLLGIVPTIAYNLILPSLFAMVAMGAFCVGWNLLHEQPAGSGTRRPDADFLAGLSAAVLMVVLGNLGTVRMVYQGLQHLAAPAGNIESAGILQRILWAAAGTGKIIGGARLPYGPGNWYWDPSRVIPPGPGNEITEFPFFTFLYSDLHAHMLAMPLALLALAWALSTFMLHRVSVVSLVFGALAIGALYPTNLSDIYTYLPLGFVVLAYVIWRTPSGAPSARQVPDWLVKLALTIGSIALLTALSYGLYEPYRAAYSQGYHALDPWMESHTPIWSYLTHWGAFLFVIGGWLAWETRQWLAHTPVSSLNKLRPYQVLIEAGIAVFLVALGYLAYRGVQIGWVALPLAAWAGVLILRPGLPDVKRFVLFLIGTAMLITIIVEIFVVRGDIGRMNTVFKFYLQAWTLLSVSTAAAFVWLIPELPHWLPRWRNTFQAGTALLLAGTALYTVTATVDKISDRMAAGVPLTLDSITFMQYAQYADFDRLMDLVHDYRAIRWMQDHVQGSPVIVEANCPEYRWCTRFTIYTGLPGVVGWNWHQRQQRTLTPQLVEDRVSDIQSFYSTTDTRTAQDFLVRYNVSYIVVGQLERAKYAGPGLGKFVANDGLLWDAVYRDGDTIIYRVRP